MIDLETLSTRPDAMIVSIGAVEFGPGGLGDVFYGVVDPARSSGHIDPATVAWWMRQSDLARSIFSQSGDALSATLRALFDFIRANRWVYSLTPSCRIWAHGAAFDIPILENAIRREGLVVPWHYRAIRDTRTILDLAGIKVQGSEDSKHLALDDAAAQALAVIEAARVLGVEPTWWTR
jgi:hypothetical protein